MPSDIDVKFIVTSDCPPLILAHPRYRPQMVRAAREHPSLKLGEDFACHLRVLQRPVQIRIDFHELPEVTLRAFNSDVRSM
jgi:hypothetical protein